MSSTLDINPPPVPCGAMAPGDSDDGFGCDCTRAMGARSTTISAVAVSTITRTDGAPVGPNDLTVPTVTQPTDGLSFGWTAVAGSNVASYLVKFKLTLASGGPIYRSFMIPVRTAVG